MKCRGVVFDLFGTLAESPSLQSYEAAVTAMAVVLGVPPGAFRRLWMDTIRARETGRFATPQDNIEHICRTMGGACDGSLLSTAAAIAVEYGRNMLLLRPEALGVLRRLKGSGLKTGLVSDTAWEIPALWRASPASSLVDAAVFSCEVGLKKPDPAIYELACSLLDLPPAECVYVGDGGSNELAGATLAGLCAVRLRMPEEDLDSAFRPGAVEWNGAVIGSLHEVLGLVGA